MPSAQRVTRKASAGFNSDDERWAAVAARDRLADGAFFYSVSTTGIYCRPGCSSRLPRRQHVRFHATVEAAKARGFRPCKRCQPDGAGLLERHGAAIAKVCNMLDAAVTVPTLETLAEAAGMSAFHFHRIFKAATGVTPRAYAAARRSNRAREALTRHDTVTTAIYESGFNSTGRFYAKSGEILGMSARAFRAGGAGETIRFVTAECSFGCMLVAATARGVCAIALGDAPGPLVEDLHSRYSKATLLGEDAALRRWVHEIVAHIDVPTRALDLPLDVRGTAFQLRVWQALSRIPAGSTASYSEIAKRIGAPGSARAVARACASNTLAIAIPCHRAIAGDGGLAGYRWGLERKKALLEREAQPARRLRKR